MNLLHVTQHLNKTIWDIVQETRSNYTKYLFQSNSGESERKCLALIPEEHMEENIQVPIAVTS